MKWQKQLQIGEEDVINLQDGLMNAADAARNLSEGLSSAGILFSDLAKKAQNLEAAFYKIASNFFNVDE